MKFSASVAVAVLSTGAFSSAVVRDLPTLVERDVATVTNILNDVGSGIDSLASAVGSYDGSDAGPVTDASKALQSTIEDGISTVGGSEELSLADALALQDPVKDLTDKASSLADSLNGKKETIQSAGECKTTRDLIGGVNDASQKLIDAVVGKVPEAAQGIAEDLSADLRKVLQDIVSSFSEANCVDSGNGGGGDSTTSPTSGPTDSPTDSPTEPTVAPTKSAPGSSPTAAPTYAPPTNGTTNSTTPTPPVSSPPVATAGAAALIPAGAMALVFAAAML